jgi:UDP-glucose 4-epimerase
VKRPVKKFSGKPPRNDGPAVLVTGARGYVGALLMKELAARRGELSRLVALDVRETPPAERRAGVEYETLDIRSAELRAVFARHRPEVVVHLASIVTPGKKSDRAFERSVDVGGTENVLAACVATGARKLIVTSSGAAYGYHADNPEWLAETDALRGNPEFAYSDHKRQVEELLARARVEHPALGQLILRPGTILGETAANQITALFEKPVVLGLTGAASPFVFAWDADVVACLVKGVLTDATGIYNVAGDGVVTLREVARALKKPYVALPVPVVAAALALMKRLGVTQYGPEQVGFLRYRPVLSNANLKSGFRYLPRKTSRETLDFYLGTKRDRAS